MKFSASFSDQGSIETFSRCVQGIARMSRKKCVIRMTENGMCLIACPATGVSMKDGVEYWIGVLFPWQPTFQTHNFIGTSEDKNEIVIELDVDHLAQCLSGNHANTKIKLAGKTEKPTLRVEIRSHAVNHEIPVELVHSKKWNMFERPNCTGQQVILALPPVKTMIRVITSLKNIHCKFLTMKASNTGDLHLQAAMKNGDVTVYFTDLVNEPVDQESQNGSQQAWSEVKLHVKPLQSFFSNFFFTHSKIKLSILSDRCAEFSLLQEDFEVSFILGDNAE